MPRSIESPGTKILSFFQTAPLAVAVLILGLAKDLVRTRQAVASDIAAVHAGKRLKKRKALPPPPKRHTPAPAKKKSHHKQVAKPAAGRSHHKRPVSRATVDTIDTSVEDLD